MTAEDFIADSPPQMDEAIAYATLVNDAITARQAMDTGRWLIGEYVRQLKTYYKQKTIEQFSDEVGIDPKRAYEYASMSSFYPLNDRAELSDLDLTYSHYREARRLGDLDQAKAFLSEIALNHWTIQQTRERLKIMLYQGVKVAPGYDSPAPITDATGAPIVNTPEYQWRGPALVTIDKKGRVQLQCDHAPEIESGKRYIVSFEEVIDS
jgi:hypothetical protein